MRWPLKIFVAAVLFACIYIAALLVPKFRNMKSEYDTAEAIHDLTKFVERHDGRWPASPAELGGKFPPEGEVIIDYAMTSSRLIENRSLIREAVHPRSGKFYTYPNYQEKLDELYKALREANASE